MKYFTLLIMISTLLSACGAIGHKGWADYMDERVGKKATVLDPTRFGNAGELIRADFLVQGKGFTHITKNENGDIIQHWDSSEVLPIYANRDPSWTSGRKEWVGKCHYYLVVDPSTYIVKSWGIDEGGNPESCRVWP